MNKFSITTIIYGIIALVVVVFAIIGLTNYSSLMDTALTEAVEKKGYEQVTSELKSKVKLSPKMDNQVKGEAAGGAMVTLSMILLFVAAAGAVVLPIVISVMNGQLKSLIYTAAVGLGLLVLFGISYVFASNEPYPKFDVTEAGSQAIGGLLGIVYILAVVAIIGIAANLFAKRFN
jgi:hypothetical protein